MNEKRRALGRGLGALIPTGPDLPNRPVDVLVRPVAVPDLPPSTSWPPPGWTADDHARENPSPTGGGSADHPDPTGPPPAAPTTPASHGDADPVERRPLREVPGATFADLPLSTIRPNPRQPRTDFDADELDELAASIREVGVLQPVVVRALPAAEVEPDGPAFELVMGERRWRAVRAAGLESVPAIVRHASDDVMLRDALLENLHRSSLNPLEEAAAYQQLLEDFGCTQEELAARISRSRPQISNTIRLLKLPALVQRRVAAGVLSAGHARALLAMPDAAAMERLAQRIVAEGLSVRATEEIVALGDADTAPHASRSARTPAARLADVESLLADRFDTRVQVALGRRTGRMTVEFASVDDLERILAVMGIERTSTTP